MTAHRSKIGAKRLRYHENIRKLSFSQFLSILTCLGSCFAKVVISWGKAVDWKS